jgi:hypothetical protein
LSRGLDIEPDGARDVRVLVAFGPRVDDAEVLVFEVGFEPFGRNQELGSRVSRSLKKRYQHHYQEAVHDAHKIGISPREVHPRWVRKCERTGKKLS